MPKYINAQKQAGKQVKRSVNRGWIKRVNPTITATQEAVTKEVLATYKIFGDLEPNLADLNKRTTLKGKKTTHRKSLTARVSKTYRLGKASTDAQMLGVSGGAYRESVFKQNFIFSIVTSKNLPLPLAKQFFIAQMEPAGGIPITSRFASNTNIEVDKVLKSIFQGLSRGESPQEMTKTIEQAFDLTRSNAMRIVRTESARMQNAGIYDQTKAFREYGLQTRRQIVSVLDDRTRPQSAQIDGQIEEIPEGAVMGTFLYPNGIRYAMPTNRGVAKYDVNDRETTIDLLPDDVPMNERVARKIEVDENGNAIVGRGPRGGELRQENETVNFANYEAWAKSRGLKKNRYGQLLFP